MGGRELGGGQRSTEEGPVCGAVDLGWGSTLYRGVCVFVAGVTTLTFHVPPFLLHPPPSSSSTPHPRRVSLSGFHDDRVAVALQLKKQARACEERMARRPFEVREGIHVGGNWQSGAFQAFNVTAQVASY